MGVMHFRAGMSAAIRWIRFVFNHYEFESNTQLATAQSLAAHYHTPTRTCAATAGARLPTTTTSAELHIGAEQHRGDRDRNGGGRGQHDKCKKGVGGGVGVCDRVHEGERRQRAVGLRDGEVHAGLHVQRDPSGVGGIDRGRGRLGTVERPRDRRPGDANEFKKNVYGGRAKAVGLLSLQRTTETRR